MYSLYSFLIREQFKKIYKLRINSLTTNIRADFNNFKNTRRLVHDESL